MSPVVPRRPDAAAGVRTPLLRALEASAGSAATWRRALAAALDGSGPPLLPWPDAPAAERWRVAEAFRPDDATAPPDGRDDDPLALVVPTSGSTGEPKGVLLTARAVRASAAATEARLAGPG